MQLQKCNLEKKRTSALQILDKKNEKVILSSLITSSQIVHYNLNSTPSILARLMKKTLNQTPITFSAIESLISGKICII